VKIKFYLKSSGRSPVEEFLKELPEPTRLEVFDALAQLEAGKNLEMPLSKNLSSIRFGLHELRFRDKAGQVRVIYYIKRGDAIYLLHAYRKKTQAISSKDMDMILKRLKEI
jgi:phage-related protein